MIKFNNKKIKNVRANNFNIIEMKFNNNIIYKNNPYLKLIYGDKFYDNDKIRYIPSYKFLDSNIIRYSYDAELIELNDTGLKSISSSSNFSENNIKNNIYTYSVDSKVLAWLENNSLNIEILDENNKTIIQNLNQSIDTITDPFYIQISPKNDLVVILGNYVLSDTTNNYYKCDIYIYNLDISTGTITSVTMNSSSHTISGYLSSNFKDREGYKLYFNYTYAKNNISYSDYNNYKAIFFADDIEYNNGKSGNYYIKVYPFVYYKNSKWCIGKSENYFNVGFYLERTTKGNFHIGLAHKDSIQTNEQLNRFFLYYRGNSYNIFEGYFKSQVNFITKDGLNSIVERYRNLDGTDYDLLTLSMLNTDNRYINQSITNFKSYGAKVYNDVNCNKFLLVNRDMDYYFLYGLGNIGITSDNLFSKTYNFDTALNNILGATFKENYLYILDYKNNEYYIKVFELDTTKSIYNLVQTITLDANGIYNGINGGDFRLGTNNALIQTKDYIIVQFNTLDGTNNIYNFYQFKPKN